MVKESPAHKEQLIALRRIEGQVRGVQKMIEERRYCVDILTQLSSVGGALLRVQDKILQRHLKGCVSNALKGRSEVEKQKKIDEIIGLLKNYRKGV